MMFVRQAMNSHSSDTVCFLKKMGRLISLVDYPNQYGAFSINSCVSWLIKAFGGYSHGGLTRIHCIRCDICMQVCLYFQTN